MPSEATQGERFPEVSSTAIWRRFSLVHVSSAEKSVYFGRGFQAEQ